MSGPLDQQPIWTPPVIATIVYRVVMIVVSIAFIWKKYRRPARQIDEEQLMGVLLPAHRHPLHRTRSATQTTQSRPTTPPQRQPHPPTLREIISAHIEDIIRSALGLDDDDDIDIGVRQLPMNNSQAGLSTYSAEVSSFDNVGLDVELGDMGLRNRSADSTSDQKDVSRAGSSKVPC